MHKKFFIQTFSVLHEITAPRSYSEFTKIWKLARSMDDHWKILTAIIDARQKSNGEPKEKVFNIFEEDIPIDVFSDIISCIHYIKFNQSTIYSEEEYKMMTIIGILKCILQCRR